MFETIWKCLKLFETIWKYLKLFETIASFKDTFETIWNYFWRAISRATDMKMPARIENFANLKKII